MKNKIKIITIVIMLVFLTNISIAENIIEKKDTSRIIYVNDDNTDGPWDGSLDTPFKNITTALTDSSEGDTIFVFNGTYYENILVNKRVTIMGEEKTLIDGMYNEYVIKITESNVVLKDLIIRNSGGYNEDSGVFVESDNNLIIGCEIYRTRTGVNIKNSEKNDVKKCIFYQNGEGIESSSSTEISIIESVFYHNANSINIQHSENVLINDCYIHTSGMGIIVNDSKNVNISKCAIYNNNDNGGGLVLFFNEKVDLYNCNFYHSGYHINMGDNRDVTISHCNFIFSNHEAILLEKNLENILFENCEFRDNIRFGVLSRGGKTKFRSNNFYNNLFGMSAEKSFCDARYNWWGSILGPSMIEKRSKRDKIGTKFGVLRFIPWRLTKNKNAGCNWEIDFDRYENKINISRYEKIEFNGVDTDGDGLPDWWENKYNYSPNSWDDHRNLDPDNDGLNNFEECYTDKWGSNPYIKDLFIEVDWVESKYKDNDPQSNKPTEDWIEKLTDVFKEKDINLHIDTGNLGGGEYIPYIENMHYEDIDDQYWDYFLHNDLNNPRKGIFHWCIISDFGPYPGLGGFSVFGWDHLDSWVISAELINQTYKRVNKDYIIISVIMHELGHTMGLFADDHGGNDNMIATTPFTKQFFKYLPYLSIMNYMYTYSILDYSDGTRGRNDFDDWGNLDFSFFKNTSFEPPSKK